MRILITGFIAIVIWSVFSMWLYVDILKPATKKPAVVQTIPESQITREADSLAKLYASMPKELLIYFEFDNTKFIPDPQTDSKIAEFKAWLDKYAESMIEVSGHTDFIGTSDYNQDLGLKRARIVQKYLVEKGISANRIVAASKGEDQPVADLLTTAGRAKNRRTVVTVKK